MSTVNSFKTRQTLQAGGRSVEYFSLPALQAAGFPGVAQPAVLAQDPAREPAAPRGWALRQGGRHRSPRRLGRQEQGAARALVRASARAPPGLHRRALCRGSRRHARRRRAPRRRRDPGESAPTGRARHRPLGAGRLLRAGQRVPAECGARVLAQQGALCVPALGTERLRTTSASCRRTPASSTRSTSNTSHA